MVHIVLNKFVAWKCKRDFFAFWCVFLVHSVDEVAVIVHWIVTASLSWCGVYQLLDNTSGELCSHYPSQLVILEYVKSEDSLQDQ